MKKSRVHYDLGMLIGISIIISLIISACVARVVYIPNANPKPTIEEYIFLKYGIWIDFILEEDIDYELVIDEETGNRVIREIKRPKKEASHARDQSYGFCPPPTAFCVR